MTLIVTLVWKTSLNFEFKLNYKIKMINLDFLSQKIFFNKFIRQFLQIFLNFEILLYLN